MRRVSASFGRRLVAASLVRATLLSTSSAALVRSSAANHVAAFRHNSAVAAPVSDKKFHCSVCKKPFRLEKAAQVHLAQAHGNEGTVEAGPGPGYVDEGPRHTAPAPNAPPSRPTIVTPMKDKAPADDDDDDYFKGTMRSAPKPLHDSATDVPENDMAAMLEVWDGIGVKRLEGFVHSSMILKVFAARPLTAKDLPSQYQIDAPEPTGDNPFLVSASTKTKCEGTPNALFTDLDMSGAFAAAPSESRGFMCPAAVANPYAASGSTKASAHVRAAAAPVAPPKPEVQTAPQTPYGQLPMFGQAPIAAKPLPDTTSPLGVATHSPFAAAAQSPFAAGATVSPFAAGATTSPFAAGATASPFAAGATASPFAAGATASPFAGAAGAASSPFAGAVSASPFAAQESPFASQASPFGGDAQASPFSASPFSTDGATPFSSGAPDAFGGEASAPSTTFAPPSMNALPAEPTRDHVCAECGKAFFELFDLAQHRKSKHNVEPLPHERKPKRKPREQLPDLPAYIPSPVDLAATSPFGGSKRDASWVETPLVVHSHAISNITLAGQVVDIEHGKDASVLSVLVDGGGEGEAIPVRCVGQAKVIVEAEVRRKSVVLVVGSLRLTPTHDSMTNKYFMNPVVHVVDAAGSIMLMDG